MKIILSSDWHLDQSTVGVDRYDDICAAIDQSVQAAIDLKATMYIMGGDLTNPNTVRSHRAVAKAIEVQCELINHGVFPIFVAGNHDVIEDGSGKTTMSALKAVGAGHVFERPEMIVHEGVHIVALPFTATSHDYDPDEHIRLTAKAISLGTSKAAPTIIVGHLNLNGASEGSETNAMPRGRNVFWPVDAIKQCFPKALVLGGHYHTPQEFDGVNIIGSMVRLRFDERHNETGYMVAEI